MIEPTKANLNRAQKPQESETQKYYAIKGRLAQKLIAIVSQLDKNEATTQPILNIQKATDPDPTKKAENEAMAAGLFAYLDMLLEVEQKNPSAATEKLIQQVENELKALETKCKDTNPLLASLIQSGLDAAKGNNFTNFDNWFRGSGSSAGALEKYFFVWIRENTKYLESLGLKAPPELALALGMFFMFLELKGQGPLVDKDFFGFENGLFALMMAQSIAIYFYKENMESNGKENWASFKEEFEGFIQAMRSLIPAGDKNLSALFGPNGPLQQAFNKFFPSGSSGQYPPSWPDPSTILGNFFNLWDQWASKYLSGSLPPD